MMPAQGIDILGILSGGRAQIDAAALSAKGVEVSQNVRGDLLARMTRMGEIVGGRLGADFTDALAAGARASSARVNNAAAKEYGFDGDKARAYLLGGLAVLVMLWVTWKR